MSSAGTKGPVGVYVTLSDPRYDLRVADLLPVERPDSGPREGDAIAAVTERLVRAYVRALGLAVDEVVRRYGTPVCLLVPDPDDPCRQETLSVSQAGEASTWVDAGDPGDPWADEPGEWFDALNDYVRVEPDLPGGPWPAGGWTVTFSPGQGESVVRRISSAPLDAARAQDQSDGWTC